MKAKTRRRLTAEAWRITLLSVALVAALLPIPPTFVERMYSAGVYPVWQPNVTALSNLVPFALADVAFVVVVAWWLGSAGIDVARRSTWLRAALRIVARTIVLAAALYVAFLFMWGFNYRRVPLIERLAFDSRAVTPEAARGLATTTIEQLNGTHGAAHQEGWPEAGTIDPLLAESFGRANRAIGGRGVVAVARPKRTLLDWYFRRASVAGMIDPYFLETLVASDLLPFERPFVVAHEWSHVAGIADEGEANFLGWLACMQASPASRYSGWLFLYDELVGAVRARDRTDLVARLAPGPHADLAAIRARIAREASPRLRAAGWLVYDRYLKANRVEAGVDSYSQVLQLVLGVALDPKWMPTTAVSTSP